MYVIVGSLNLWPWPICSVFIANLPSTGCQLVGNPFEVHKQVSKKITRLIAVKFGYEVLLEMDTE
jgi:hypothetical protein